MPANTLEESLRPYLKNSLMNDSDCFFIHNATRSNLPCFCLILRQGGLDYIQESNKQTLHFKLVYSASQGTLNGKPATQADLSRFTERLGQIIGAVSQNKLPIRKGKVTCTG